MTSTVTVSLDGMGGDHAPTVVIDGAAEALLRHPGVRFRISGDENQLKPLLENYSELKAACEIVHTEEAVRMSDKPSEAVRRGRKTSMWLAIDAVRKGDADVIISGGNTGALMAMSKIQLKTMPGISRPAIAGIWPTMKGEAIVLDLGANLEADEKQLVDFSIMGEAFAQAVLGVADPSVGLLNIGAEELKGHEEIRSAAQIIRDGHSGMNFHGFVEGDDIGKGTVDVIVTDGFTGNVALKAAEGTARQFAFWLRSAMGKSILSRIGAFFAIGAFKALKARMDPSSSNGGVFLGLNGLVVKSHGGADRHGYTSAIEQAIDLAESDFAKNIETRLHEIYGEEKQTPTTEGTEKQKESLEAQ